MSDMKEDARKTADDLNREWEASQMIYRRREIVGIWLRIAFMIACLLMLFSVLTLSGLLQIGEPLLTVMIYTALVWTVATFPFYRLAVLWPPKDDPLRLSTHGVARSVCMHGRVMSRNNLVVSNDQLIPGKWYWCRVRGGNNLTDGTVSQPGQWVALQVKQDGGDHKPIMRGMWCDNSNSQEPEHYEIRGPIQEPSAEIAEDAKHLHTHEDADPQGSAA